MTRSIAEIEKRIADLSERSETADDIMRAYLDGMIDALAWSIGKHVKLEVHEWQKRTC